jgi:hypothetical protein
MSNMSNSFYYLFPVLVLAFAALLILGFFGGGGAQGCSTLWNGQDFEQVIDARQSGAVAVLAEGAGLA